MMRALRLLLARHVGPGTYEYLQAAGAVGSAPRQLLGRLRAPEINGPSVAHLYDTNHTLGYVHDLTPSSLTAAAGQVTSVQLLSVRTVSFESAEADAKSDVVARAMKLYEAAKATRQEDLLAEHRQGWAALWDGGYRGRPKPCVGKELKETVCDRKTSYAIRIGCARRFLSVVNRDP